MAGTKNPGGTFESRMAIDKNSAIENARNDLAKRLNINAADVKEKSVEDSDFPDMALGAAEDGEMSGQMITPRLAHQARSAGTKLRIPR